MSERRAITWTDRTRTRFRRNRDRVGASVFPRDSDEYSDERFVARVKRTFSDRSFPVRDDDLSRPRVFIYSSATKLPRAERVA